MAYTAPTAGTENWDVPLNQALSDIDKTAEDSLAGGGASVDTAEDSSSLVYADLTTVGPSVTVTVSAARTALVFTKAQVVNTTTADDVYTSFAVSGATVLAASDTRAMRHNGTGTAEAYSAVSVVALAAGTSTFTAKYRTDGGVARWANRVLAVVIT